MANTLLQQYHRSLASMLSSVVLPADFSPTFNENEVGITEFQYRNQDHNGLAESGNVCRRQLVIIS